MNYFSDTLTISLVLVLLFGSIALYLYTRIQQSEQKVSLLESILLDLKMSNEIKEYTELPASDLEEYVPYDAKEKNVADELQELPLHAHSNEQVQYDSLPEDLSEESNVVTVEPVHNEVNEANEVIEPSESIEVDVLDSEPMFESKVNYDTMHLKDLQTLAKSRGITGVTKKGPLIEALKVSDKAVKPGSNGQMGAGPGSFLETSASFSNESL
jgi:hypothetical protein